MTVNLAFLVSHCGHVPNNLKRCILAQLSLKLHKHIVPKVFYPCAWLCCLNFHICLLWGPGKMQEPKLLADPVHSSRVLPLPLKRVSIIYLPSTLGYCLGFPCCPTLVAPKSLSISYSVRRKANLSISIGSSVNHYFEIQNHP